MGGRYYGPGFIDDDSDGDSLSICDGPCTEGVSDTDWFWSFLCSLGHKGASRSTCPVPYSLLQP